MSSISHSPSCHKIVAFYLTQESQYSTGQTSGYDAVRIEVTDSGQPVSRSALRVTFSRNAPLEKPLKLIVFGSDPQRCNVTLTAGNIQPVHCSIFAQLNSGPTAWLVEDE